VTLPKRLVLDANILLRGVLGNKVRALLEAYESDVSFYSPDVCFEDARAYIPSVAKRRQLDVAMVLAVLDQLEKIVEVIDRSLYEAHESVARNRMASRDIED
jgi:predicted nucleic acid-binding protein